MPYKKSKIYIDNVYYAENMNYKNVYIEYNDEIANCSDIVVANIIADIIKILAKDIKNFMKDDAVFISSGIIHAKVDEVKASLEENGLEIIEVQSLGEWNAIVSKIK